MSGTIMTLLCLFWRLSIVLRVPLSIVLMGAKLTRVELVMVNLFHTKKGLVLFPYYHQLYRCCSNFNLVIF